MVGDMLQVAEIESGTLQIKRDDVRVGQLLKDIQAEYQAQAADKDLKLQFNIPPKLPIVQGDRDKLIMAVQNLVGNAMKYTPDGGRIWITVTAEDKDAVIHFQDTGIGIPPAMLSRIFELFTQVRAAGAGEQSGLGIGLALVKDLVELHGGSVQARSDGPGEGSVFTVRLPLALPQRPLRL
jgi:two-component system CheB/CheR fusion protein